MIIALNEGMLTAGSVSWRINTYKQALMFLGYTIVPNALVYENQQSFNIMYWSEGNEFV